jgi:hypothetical protein
MGINFKGALPTDALVAGEVYRVTFIQTTVQEVGAFLFGNIDWGAELAAVYQRGGDVGKMPYAFPVSQPPVADAQAVVVDFKVRSAEYHAGTVADLANAADQLSQFVSVSQVEKPSRADLGTAGRGTAIDTATQAGNKTAQDTGFGAGLTKTLKSLGTVLIVLAVGAGLVAVAYVVSKVPKPS